MDMTPSLTVATTLGALNIVLLLALGAVWLKNYRTFRSTMTLGLLAFAAVMLLENLVAVYYFFSMEMLYVGSVGAQQSVLVLRALQFVALLFLTYVTMQ